MFLKQKKILFYNELEKFMKLALVYFEQYFSIICLVEKKSYDDALKNKNSKSAIQTREESWLPGVYVSVPSTGFRIIKKYA